MHILYSNFDNWWQTLFLIGLCKGFLQSESKARLWQPIKKTYFSETNSNAWMEEPEIFVTLAVLTDYMDQVHQHIYIKLLRP